MRGKSRVPVGHLVRSVHGVLDHAGQTNLRGTRGRRSIRFWIAALLYVVVGFKVVWDSVQEFKQITDHKAQFYEVVRSHLFGKVLEFAVKYRPYVTTRATRTYVFHKRTWGKRCLISIFKLMVFIMYCRMVEATTQVRNDVYGRSIIKILWECASGTVKRYVHSYETFQMNSSHKVRYKIGKQLWLRLPSRYGKRSRRRIPVRVVNFRANRRSMQWEYVVRLKSGKLVSSVLGENLEDPLDAQGYMVKLGFTIVGALVSLKIISNLRQHVSASTVISSFSDMMKPYLSPGTEHIMSLVLKYITKSYIKQVELMVKALILRLDQQGGR